MDRFGRARAHRGPLVPAYLPAGPAHCSATVQAGGSFSGRQLAGTSIRQKSHRRSPPLPGRCSLRSPRGTGDARGRPFVVHARQSGLPCQDKPRGVARARGPLRPDQERVEKMILGYWTNYFSDNAGDQGKRSIAAHGRFGFAPSVERASVCVVGATCCTIARRVAA